MPHLQEVYEKYKDQGLKVVAVSNETADALRPYAEKKGLTFPILVDPTGEVFNQYKAQYIPFNVLIDKEGKAVAVMEGFDPAEFDKQITNVIPSLLKEETQSASR